MYKADFYLSTSLFLSCWLWFDVCHDVQLCFARNSCQMFCSDLRMIGETARRKYTCVCQLGVFACMAHGKDTVEAANIGVAATHGRHPLTFAGAYAMLWVFGAFWLLPTLFLLRVPVPS